MAKSKRTYDKPLTLDMDFDEALGRFVQTKPSELPERPGAGDVPVTLYEDDTGDRFLIYSTDRGNQIELRYAGDQPWFTQRQLADMFGVTVPTVINHIKGFTDGGELDGSTIRDFEVVRREGDRQIRRSVQHYGLDLAFYVGYRVNSSAGVLFRRWATAILIQFATKGFVIDKERLKNPDDPGVVDELRNIIDEIRAAGANAYREVKKICAACADYDGSSETARNFFASIENKMLWVATAEQRSMTSAELIMSRADISKPDMGLTYYAGRRGPTQKDVTTGTNYLSAEEQQIKNRVINLVLRYFEDQHRQRRLIYMVDLEHKLDEFIKFNGWPLLTHLGKAKGERARDHAKKLLAEYKRQIS